MLYRRRLLFWFLFILVAFTFLKASNGSVTARADSVALPWSRPPGYRIIYLIARDAVAPSSLITPVRLEATLGAQPVHNWDDLVRRDASSPIDALIVHDSALPLIDSGWLTNAYQRGVVTRLLCFGISGPL